MFAEKSKKVFTDVCLYRFAAEWVKPYTAQKNEEVLNGKLHFLCSDIILRFWFFLVFSVFSPCY